MFFACKSNFEDVQKIGILDAGPLTIAENINTKYTDSGRIKSILLSPKMHDYSNRDFPFVEFPESVDLTILDADDNESNIIADYAIVYDQTDLIDLRGNVVLSTHQKDTLFAEQLYYDQKKQWLFTNVPVKFRTKNELINGNGFDSNRDFTNAQVLEVTGKIYIDE